MSTMNFISKSKTNSKRMVFYLLILKIGKRRRSVLRKRKKSSRNKFPNQAHLPLTQKTTIKIMPSSDPLHLHHKRKKSKDLKR